MSKKVLVDTSVLIPFYNSGKFADRLLPYSVHTLIHFCSVSINEFIRGAHNAASKEIVEELLQIAGKNLLNPTVKHWLECGKVSEKILKQKKRSKTNVMLLQNDILIALCTRDEGFTLITADKTDFKLIQNHLDVLVEYWD